MSNGPKLLSSENRSPTSNSRSNPFAWLLLPFLVSSHMNWWALRRVFEATSKPVDTRWNSSPRSAPLSRLSVRAYLVHLSFRGALNRASAQAKLADMLRRPQSVI
ncbi:hypothetical protein FB45DRAFT_1059153 [Roridomyces roridus]|uniref:Uncharacterized protein n=1 Tax=Roridomyces roridus TaxID=1738132 RepID=A0AAD7BRU3_9AGAR|nr:hypothetical protein FB45DRAFT_1059153 [Roridomyces roridus]